MFALHSECREGKDRSYGNGVSEEFKINMIGTTSFIYLEQQKSEERQKWD
jgi:hypothetical protein